METVSLSGFPSTSERKQILSRSLDSTSSAVAGDVDFDFVARQTFGLTGPDLVKVVEHAASTTISNGAGGGINTSDLLEGVRHVARWPGRQGSVYGPHDKKKMAFAAAGRAVVAARYDTDAELAALSELYVHLRLYVNFFQPQMKLVEKIRTGAKVHKRYDQAQTPYQRLLDSKISAKAKKDLTRQYVSLNPVQLKRDITKCQDKLLRLAKRKEMQPRKEVKPPIISRTFSVRQRKSVSRAS